MATGENLDAVIGLRGLVNELCGGDGAFGRVRVRSGNTKALDALGGLVLGDSLDGARAKADLLGGVKPAEAPGEGGRGRTDLACCTVDARVGDS